MTRLRGVATLLLLSCIHIGTMVPAFAGTREPGTASIRCLVGDGAGETGTLARTIEIPVP